MHGGQRLRPALLVAPSAMTAINWPARDQVVPVLSLISLSIALARRRGVPRRPFVGSRCDHMLVAGHVIAGLSSCQDTSVAYPTTIQVLVVPHSIVIKRSLV